MQLSWRTALTLLCTGSVLLGIASTAGAQDQRVRAEDVQQLLSTLNAVDAAESVRIVQDEAGFITFIGAPKGAEFITPTSAAKSAVNANTVAMGFAGTHQRVFGVNSDAVTFQSRVTYDRRDRSFVHLKQMYGDVEVFGSDFVVQVNNNGAVVSAHSDIMRDSSRLDTAEITAEPTLSPQEAVDAAILFAQSAQADGGTVAPVGDPQLYVYRPDVVGNDGATRLVWIAEIESSVQGRYRQSIFVDAHSGDIAFHYSLLHNALDRRIYDSGFVEVPRLNLVRTEGQPRTGISDADFAYTYIGDTYNFFLDNHNRDGIDDIGGPIHASVNFGTVPNAFFFASFIGTFDIVFGPGWATDDIVAHEYTHGVTFFTSDLIYFGESGAINESFSDIWGEFVDLTNGAGNDSPEVRWLIGEDIIPTGAIRSMSDPPSVGFIGSPDRLNSPLYFDIPFFDNGGVHFNSGIGNKLAFLLVEGQTFNGLEVSPVEPDLNQAIVTVAKLLYESQFILPRGASYFDLYSAIAEATGILQDDPTVLLDDAQINTIANAMRAIEIEPPSRPGQLTEVRAFPARTSGGAPAIVLEWRPPAASGFQITNIVRKLGGFPMSPTDGTQLNLNNAIPGPNGVIGLADTGLEDDREYFYTFFWDSDESFPGMSFVRATTGENPGDLLTEVFGPGTINPFDLRFSQLLFSPTIDSADAEASGQPREYVDITDYAVSIRQGVAGLPVQRLDQNGNGGISITMIEDGIVDFPFPTGRVFPFFGGLETSLRLSGNGYLDFGGPVASDPANFPSLASHFSNPRISFLFANLANSAGGEIWVKNLDDRFVVTYDGIPEQRVTFPFPVGTSSVQVELFYSGHVRITYEEVDVTQAIVGLSDGHGVAVALSNFLPGTPSRIPPTDFTSESQNDPDVLTIWPPTPIQIGREGDTITFTVQTNSPNEPARLCATWDGPADATLPPLDPTLPCATNRAPFSDNNDGTGTFTWRPTFQDAGAYTVNVLAETVGGESASQAIQVLVSDTGFQPRAANLRIVTGEPNENPAADRQVDTSSNLNAEFDYIPGVPVSQDPTAAEGQTTIRWFRNGAAIAALTNSPGVPAAATQIGDVWSYAVVPVTIGGVQGELATSPRVTIGLPPVIDRVTPDVVSFLGGTTVSITGRRLTNPTSVTFNGIESSQVLSFGDEELQALVPPGIPGPVTIVVTTAAGTTTLANALEYVTPESLKLRADMNHDGKVNAVDVQMVVEAVLTDAKTLEADTNEDGRLSTLDVQIVVNIALSR